VDVVHDLAVDVGGLIQIFGRAPDVALPDGLEIGKQLVFGKQLVDGFQRLVDWRRCRSENRRPARRHKNVSISIVTEEEAVSESPRSEKI
jgi:hypothetical protein